MNIKLNVLFRNSRIHCDLLYDLNAWDKRHLDQPDFDCRMNTFKKIKVLLDNNDVSVEFGAFVIYNCFYIFNNVSNNTIINCKCLIEYTLIDLKCIG